LLYFCGLISKPEANLLIYNKKMRHRAEIDTSPLDADGVLQALSHLISRNKAQNEPIRIGDFIIYKTQNRESADMIAPCEENPPDDWVDGYVVMKMLNISPRTLQTLRSNGTLPFSRIGNKLFYRKSDILKILSHNYTMLKISGK